MMKKAPFLIASLMASSAFSAEDAERAAIQFFEKEVRPILVNRCYECHAEKKQKGSLRVDNIAFIKKGGDSGSALVEGDPAKSLIIQAVRYHDSDLEMPPKEKLPAKEIAALEQWVKIGAPWPQAEATKVRIDEFGFTEEDRQYWAFQPLSHPVPPKVKTDWVRTDIDRFVAKKHAELGLTPAP